MTTTLTLATQKPFGSLTCDFYKDDSNEFYITRELELHWNTAIPASRFRKFTTAMQTD